MKFWLVNSYLILLSFTELYSQEKIKYKADELKFRRINKEPVRKLIKNVILKQGDTEIKCDSANFFNKRNVMEAYGNVIITNSDSSIITSNLLIYDGNDKIAKLRENVIYVKNNEEIKTDRNLSEQDCYFEQNSVPTSPTDQNIDYVYNYVENNIIKKRCFTPKIIFCVFPFCIT